MQKPVIFATICAFSTFIFTFLYLNSLELRYKIAGQRVKVLIATKYIDQGCIIDESMISEQEIPKEFIQPKALQSLKDIKNSEGQNGFIAMAPIEKDEQILTTKLYPLGIETGISSIIPTNMRAVTLSFERELVYGIIKPGNRVDIIGVFDYENKEGKLQQSAVTLLQNILILSVGKSIFGVPKTNPNSNQTNEKTSIDYSFEGKIPVSFIVTPIEAEILLLASEKGIIRFSIRPTADETTLKITDIKMQDLFKDGIINDTKKEKIDNVNNNPYLMELQKKQREALQLLKKYQVE